MKKIVCLMMLLITAFMFNAQSQVLLPLFQENFDEGVFPAGWLQIDADADGYMWETAANPASYVDGQLTGYGHNNSAGFMLSGSWSNVMGEAIEPDNWLITPPVELTSEAVLKFWVCAQDASYAEEHYGVYITTNTDDELTPEDFTLFYEEDLDADGGLRQGAWKQKTVDLSDYTGQTVRIAFRHFDCEDMFLLDLDDVEILTESFDPTITVTPTTINFNSVLLGDTSSVRMAVITGFNFTGDITATTDYPFEISLDGEEYGTSVTMDAEGDTLYVRFIPTDQSEVVGLVMLSATGASNAIVLAGKGEDCIIQEEEMPLTQSFETANDLMCWTILRATTNNSISLSTQSTVGTHSLQFSSISTSTDYNQWLITPELPEVSGKVVSFDYKRHNSTYTENFRVGYSTTTNDLTAFTWGPVVEVNEDLNWHTYVNTSIPGEAKYVAINYCSNYAYYLYIDNMKVSEATGCMFPTDLAIDDVTGHTAHVSWTPAGSADGTETFYVEYLPQGEEEWQYAFTSESELILEDLLPETHYNVRLYMDCSSETSDTVYGAFTTPEACGNPTNLVVAGTTGTTATLRWTPSPLAEGTGYEYHIEYATEEGDWQSASTTTTGNEYILSGLDQQTAYNVRVFMDCDESGDGYSDTLTATFSTKCLSGGEWEIGDGSYTYNYYLPTYANYNYSYTQQIYLAEELNGANDILSIAFKNTNSYSLVRHLTIYLMPTDAATATAWLDASAATLVYSNPSTALVPGWNTFMFTSPFQYDGTSNIAVIVIDSTGSWTSSYPYWSSHTPTSSLARYVYNDGTPYSIDAAPTSGYPYDYRSDVIFGMPCNEEAQCIAPVITIGEVTSDAITVAWVPGYNETAWTVAYKAEGEEEWTEAVASVSESPYTITGLDPATVYSVRVGSLCAEEPEWSLIKTAITECVAVVVTEDEPFSEDFDELTAGIPLCWDNSEGTTTNDSYKWNYYATGQNGHCLRFNSFSNSNGLTNMLKTPVMNVSELSNPQLTFNYKNPNGGDFSVYLSTDGGATYLNHPIATGLTGVSSWTTAVYPLGELAEAENVVVVFKGTSNWGNNDAFIYLDEVIVGNAPECASPEKNSVTFSDIDGHNATVHFVDIDENHDSWRVYYRPVNDTVEIEWEYVDVDSDMDTVVAYLTELDPLTQYEVYVVTICDEPGVDATTIKRFTTTVRCPAPQNVELTELTTTSATLSWNSNAGSFIVEIHENGDEEEVEPITIDENEIEFTELTPATTYTVRIIADCGELDSLSVAATFTFTTQCVNVVVTNAEPFVENFDELTSGIPVCWDNSEGTVNYYRWGYYASGQSGHCVRFDSYSNSSGTTNMLKTPVMNLSALTSPQLAFSFKNPAGGDFSVYLSTNGGLTYTTPIATGLTGVSSWTDVVYPLGELANAENVVVVFKGTSNWGYNDAYIYLDNVVVGNAPSCLSPEKNSVTFTSIGAHTATVNFVDTVESHNAWTVYYKVDTSHVWTPVPVEGTQSVTLTGLDPETTYQVYVVTNCDEPDETQDATVTKSFTTDVACPAPTGVSVQATTNTAQVTWTGDAESYIVECGEYDVTVDGNTATITGLSSSSSYTVSVKADCGDEGTSTAVTVTFRTACDVVNEFAYEEDFEEGSLGCWTNENLAGTNPWTVVSGSTSAHSGTYCVKLNWNRNTSSRLTSPIFDLTNLTSPMLSFYHKQADDDDVVDTFAVYYRTSITDEWVRLEGYSQVTDGYELDSLALPNPSSTYQIAFVGYGIYGMAIYLDDIRLYDADGGETPPTPVELPTVTTNAAANVGQTNATLSGTITNPGNVAIMTKGFKWQQDGATTYNDEPVTGETFTATLTTLTPNTLYRYKAYVTTADTTLYGAELTFTTEGTTPQPPAVPTVATNDANPFDQTTATLHATITNPDNVAIVTKGFQVRATDGGTYAPVDGEGTGNTFTANLTGLTPATGYTFKAFITTADTTVFGDEKTFTTLEEVVEPCDVPTNITFSEITKESMKVSWTANADVTEWKVQYRAQNAETWTNGSTQTNSYLMTGLIPQTTYEVQVQAVCSADNVSAWSEIVTETTLEDGLQSHLAKNVVLYPNPAKEFVTVQCTMDNVQFEIETVEVLDVYGKLISTVDMVENPTRINVSGLANGMYFVRVTTDQGVVTKTFIKK